MKISEIFCSIDGEGPRVGLLATFIRTYGCLLRCSYCDSMYAVEGDDYKDMSVEEIMEDVANLDHLTNKRITLTGGEPLIQPKAPTLIAELSENGYEVQIETCGAVNYTKYLSMDNVFVTADWKCSSSGMSDKMIREQIKYLRPIDVLKFVVGSEDDLIEMKEISSETAAQIYVSPVFGKIEPKKIVEFMMDHELPNVRVQIQLHKVLWKPDMRGV